MLRAIDTFEATKSLDPDEQAIKLAISDLAAWASHHQTALAVGRCYGFELLMSKATKKALAKAGASPIALVNIRVPEDRATPIKKPGLLDRLFGSAKFAR
jgi:hypothetical protein